MRHIEFYRIKANVSMQISALSENILVNFLNNTKTALQFKKIFQIAMLKIRAPDQCILKHP